MKPVLFKFDSPDWLSFLPDTVSIHSYGLMIGLGIILSYLVAVKLGKTVKVNSDLTASIFLWVFFASVVGGKIFFYLEKPEIYLSNPSKMLTSPGSGFVFYGSLIFAIPTLVFFLRKKGIPVWSYLDVVAIFAPILHMFGRLGCFMAGCCHGSVCESTYGVVFSDPESKASPLNTPLYPTQLYSVFMLLSIVVVLYLIRNKKKFQGQLFLMYIIVYSIGRGIIEIFRGDEARGYVIDGILSHSQTIALVIISFALLLWSKRIKAEKAS